VARCSLAVDGGIQGSSLRATSFVYHRPHFFERDVVTGRWAPPQPFRPSTDQIIISLHASVETGFMMDRLVDTGKLD
jgi:hypothetical protein